MATPRCNYPTENSNSLADALTKRGFRVDRHTILSSIEILRFEKGRSEDYIPSVDELEGYLKGRSTGITLDYRVLTNMLSSGKAKAVPNSTLLVTEQGNIIDLVTRKVLNFNSDDPKYVEIINQAGIKFDFEESVKITSPTAETDSKPQSKSIRMVYSFGNNKREGVTADTTFEAIVRGERTSTTRYESEGHIDYYKDIKEGDIVEIKGENGNTVLVKVTAAPHKLDPTISAEEWSKKEGWSEDYFNSEVKPRIDEAWQMEFEYVSGSVKYKSKKGDEIPGITLTTTKETAFSARTKENAAWSDVTIALAEDFDTSGEKSTAEAAGAEVEKEERIRKKDGKTYEAITKITKVAGKYVPVDISKITDPAEIAESILSQIKERGLPMESVKLNIAGNDISNLKGEQSRYDKLLIEVLKELQKRGLTIQEVRSGGQTGIDEAGVKAARDLGIKASIHTTGNYRFIGKEGGKGKADKEGFIRRFNPSYKEPTDNTIVITSKTEAGAKKSRAIEDAKWSEEDEQQKKELAEKAKGFVIRLPKVVGTAAFATELAKRYQFADTNIIRPSADDDFDTMRKEMSNAEYRTLLGIIEKICKTLGLNHLNPDIASPAKAAKAKNRLMSMLLVDDSDGVFLTGNIAKPEENFYAFTEREPKYNIADFVAVESEQGLIARYATSIGKPVYVFGKYGKSEESWYKWDDHKQDFIECEAPKLTSNPFIAGIGHSGKAKGSFRRTLGEETHKAVADLFANTFGVSLEAVKTRTTIEGTLLRSDLTEEAQAIDEAADQYKEQDVPDNDFDFSPEVKISLDMSYLEQKYRAEMMARDFRNYLDDVIWEETDFYTEDYAIALEEEAEKLEKEGKDKDARTKRKEAKAARAKYLLFNGINGETEEQIRRAVLRDGGLDKVFEKMRREYQDQANNESNSKSVREAYQKILDNFDILITRALDRIQGYENFRLVLFKKKDKLRGNTTASQTDQAILERFFGDNEDGEGMNGSDGWGFHIRFVDPRTSLSMLTKKALQEIPMLDNQGEKVRDDLGNIRYMNGDYAHALLINELSNMIDADDFCINKAKEEGDDPIYSFPALENMKSQYPWIQGLIDKLAQDNQLASAFFHDFNKSFIYYSQLAENGKIIPLNSQLAELGAMDSLKRNYYSNVPVNGLSIYGVNGLNRENAKKLNDLLGELEVKRSKTTLSEDELKSFALKLSNILGGLGFNTDPIDLMVKLPSMFDKRNRAGSQFEKLSLAISSILLTVSSDKGYRGKTVKTSDSYVDTFKNELKTISQIVGKITELDTLQSFKDGHNVRYSYSAPNFAINLVKKLQREDRRKQYMQEEFGYDKWFFDNGEWNKGWLSILAAADYEGSMMTSHLEEYAEARYLLEHMKLTEVVSIEEANHRDGAVPYSEWTKNQLYSVLFSQFFQAKVKNAATTLANYHFPIFSDSPANMFITMKRFMSDNRHGTFEEQLMPYLISVVKQEMYRIYTVRERRKARERGEVRGLSEIQNYDKNGEKYHFFPELNTETVIVNGREVSFKKYAQAFIDRKNINGLDEVIEQVLNKVMKTKFIEFLGDIDSIDSWTRNFIKWGAFDEVKESKDLGITKEQAEAENHRLTEEALRNYFWNSVFATSQIIQLTTTDLAYYKSPVDFQKRFKEVYAGGGRLNTNSRWGRKTENYIIISDALQTSTSFVGTKKLLETAVREKRMSEAFKNSILEKFKDINVTDAQAFRNPYAFRAVLDMMGMWTDDMNEAFERIVHREADEKDFWIIWQPIKPFVFSCLKKDNGLGSYNRVPHQNKNSEFLVLAFYDMVAGHLTNNPFLRGIGKFFEQNQHIDLIQYSTAVKAGGEGIIDLNYNYAEIKNYLTKHPEVEAAARESFKKKKDSKAKTAYQLIKEGLDYRLENGNISQEQYNETFESFSMTADQICDFLEEQIKDENGELDSKAGKFNKDRVHSVSYSDYMIAQPTPGHLLDETEATSGSQFRNLILANLSDTFEAVIEINGKRRKLNKKQIQDLYRGCIVSNLIESFNELTKEFNDIHKLQQFLLQSIQDNPKYGQDIIDALKIIRVPSPINPGKTIEVFNLPLDLPTISNQIQELLTQVFKNRVTKQKINGGSCVMVSCVGLNRKLQIKKRADGTIEYAECILPAWSKKYFSAFLTTKTDKDGNTYQEFDISKVREQDKELLNIIGYRIPTENKYSMMPLRVVGFSSNKSGDTIILPADITTIAGSDFDVDKMYLRIPYFEVGEDGYPKKVGYDIDENLTEKMWKGTSDLSKRQRDNLMIDIEYAILTSQEGSEQVHKPGNFDRAKRQARISRIMDMGESVIQQFLKDVGKIVDEEVLSRASWNPETLLHFLEDRKNEDGTKGVTLEELDKFLEQFDSAINVLTPQAYRRFHTQNMTGASLIGSYANGASAHAKMQETFLKIKSEYTFSINGRLISSLHDSTVEINGETFYIQDFIAELQGASVDNAKDPILGDLYQSLSTAGVALFMLRAGMSLDEMSYMFMFKKRLETTRGNFKTFLKNIKPYIPQGIKDRHASSIDMVGAALTMDKFKPMFELLNRKGITPEEVEALKEQLGITNAMFIDMLYWIKNTWGVLSRIESLQESLKPGNTLLKRDSQSNAIALTFPGIKLQVWETALFENMCGRKSFPFEGKYPRMAEREFVRNGVVSQFDSKQQMLEKFMACRLPHIQAFYTLGIELPMASIRKEIIQGHEVLDNSVDGIEYILSNAPRGTISIPEMNAFYREFITFIMSDTKTFGENFDVQRRYYLYKFPVEFTKLRKKLTDKYPELKGNITLMRLGRTKGDYTRIAYNRVSQMTPELKATIRADLNALIHHEEEEVRDFATKLFKYSYFRDGFNYGSQSIGAFFDANFWAKFPDVLNKLRTIRKDGNALAHYLEKFTPQWRANHSDDAKDQNLIFVLEDASKIHDVRGKDVPEGTIALDSFEVSTYVNPSYSYDYIRIKVGDNMYSVYKRNTDIKQGDWVYYSPMTVFDEPYPVYNYNDDLEEMGRIYYQDRKRKEKEKQQKSQYENITNSSAASEASPIDEAPTQSETADMEDDSPEKPSHSIPAALINVGSDPDALPSTLFDLYDAGEEMDDGPDPSHIEQLNEAVDNHLKEIERQQIEAKTLQALDDASVHQEKNLPSIKEIDEQTEKSRRCK